eukprot:6723265-Ditylum_brightwellii.AAC.1
MRQNNASKRNEMRQNDATKRDKTQQINATKLRNKTRHKKDDCVDTPNKKQAKGNEEKKRVKTQQNATKRRDETTQQNATKRDKTTRRSYATTHNAMTLLTDDVLARFVYKMLLVIGGQPMYADINRMSKILYANAAKVATTLGGGNKGHISLVMKASLYATISTIPYAAPTEPSMPTN